MVFLVFTRLVNVDLSKVFYPPLKDFVPDRHMIETTLIRLDDLKLLIKYCKGIVDRNELPKDTKLTETIQKLTKVQETKRPTKESSKHK